MYKVRIFLNGKGHANTLVSTLSNSFSNTSFYFIAFFFIDISVCIFFHWPLSLDFHWPLGPYYHWPHDLYLHWLLISLMDSTCCLCSQCHTLSFSLFMECVFSLCHSGMETQLLSMSCIKHQFYMTYSKMLYSILLSNYLLVSFLSWVTYLFGMPHCGDCGYWWYRHSNMVVPFLDWLLAMYVCVLSNMLYFWHAWQNYVSFQGCLDTVRFQFQKC